MTNLDEYFISLLNDNLLLAMGCTEPISIAYCAALAKDLLNEKETILKIDVEVSANIIKNVKSVVVPNTNGLRGIEAATAAGIVAGNSSNKLEVISHITIDDINLINELLNKNIISVNKANSKLIFDIVVTIFTKNHYSKARIALKHTNIVLLEKDNKVYASNTIKEVLPNFSTLNPNLTIENIVKFSETVDLSLVKDLLDKQINYNMAIANEGLKNNYGASIGRIILKDSLDIKTKAKAYAAAGSDARMNGCSMAVMINCGSGNQGITCSVPVIIYANELKSSKENLYRALLISTLTTIRLKESIGPLSAYCGATSAGVGAASGICYLLGGKTNEISHTIVNALAIASGMICDGAKASCAAKIAIAVENGILGMEMYRNGAEFYSGDGIVIKGVENTINNIGRVASEGMVSTDNEIIKIMLGDKQ